MGLLYMTQCEGKTECLVLQIPIQISEYLSWGRESDGKVSVEEDRELTTFMKSEF